MKSLNCYFVSSRLLSLMAILVTILLGVGHLIFVIAIFSADGVGKEAQNYMEAYRTFSAMLWSLLLAFALLGLGWFGLIRQNEMAIKMLRSLALIISIKGLVEWLLVLIFIITLGSRWPCLGLREARLYQAINVAIALLRSVIFPALLWYICGCLYYRLFGNSQRKTIRRHFSDILTY
ncbi:MAG: hypothetical protein HZA31_10460 [Opitutae bacterium]|nr:hypothetical protein [Opitutae bacterium]